jgi:hypothetical protein
MPARRTSRKNLEGTASMKAIRGLSDYRRGEIGEAISQLEIASRSDHYPAAIAHGNTFRKVSTMRPTVLPTSSTNTDMLGPEVYSPLFLLANLNLPRDRVTMNAWNRIFYDTHPIVRNGINLHASYPISKINITCKSKKVQQFFQELAEQIDLYSVVYGVALEYWKHGECFAYAELDRDNSTWKRITILNPDYVHVKKAAIGDQTIVSMRPDASLQRLVNSTNPSDMLLKRRIPRHIVNSVKRGENIPLDNMNVSHLKLLSSPYDIRGTSVIVSIYKDLMLYDKLRESKFSQADGMVNPLTLVKLGGSEGYRPGQADIDAFRAILEEAQYDKDFKLVTHDGVTIERVGFSGTVLDISPDIELINNNIYAGLMVPKALMDQESATYASSSVGLEVLRQRYDIFRNMIKKWLEKKIFAPICEMQDFFEYVDGEKRLVVPNVDFNHMNLYDMNDYIQNISNFVGTKQVSLQTLYRSLGLSYEEEQSRLRKEAIDFARRTREEAIMNNMRLSELENLSPEKPIPEPVEAVAAGEGMGMEEGGLPGMGGPDLGGAGGLPSDLGGGAPLGGGEEGLPPPPIGGEGGI